MWGMSLLHVGLLDPQKGLRSMYLLVTSISIGRIPGKVLKMCETYTLCGLEFVHECSQKTARD